MSESRERSVMFVGGDRAIEERFGELLREQCAISSITWCESAAAAREGFEQRPSGAVIIDFRTVRRETVSLIKDLRARSATVLVVVSSQQSEAAIGETVLDAGADHYVTAPRDIESLVQIFSGW